MRKKLQFYDFYSQKEVNHILRRASIGKEKKNQKEKRNIFKIRDKLETKDTKMIDLVII